jgi:hypothetical protein
MASTSFLGGDLGPGAERAVRAEATVEFGRQRQLLGWRKRLKRQKGAVGHAEGLRKRHDRERRAHFT